MNELALFAGAGGGILGGKLLGWKTVCAVEIGEYQRNILLARQNDGSLDPFPIWDDVRTFDGKPWRGLVDVITGGFPCQDISIAGRGKSVGINGKRSGLWGEMHRIICEVQPSHVIVENSSMLASRGLGRVLGDLASIGYDAEWDCIHAAHVGAPHLRDRIWIYAYPNSVLLGCNSKRKEHEKNNHRKPESRRELVSLVASQWQGWPTEPDVCGVAYGLADRVDRIHAAGNGQVPRVVADAWNTLARRRGV